MGDVQVGIVHGTANTSTGNQTFTDSNFGGGTPKAAFFIVQAHSGTFGVEQDHVRIGWGAAIATDKRWCIAASSEHDVGTSNANRRANTDECCQLLDADATAVAYEADFISFGANAVTINWALVDAAVECSVVVVLFGGTDLEVDLFTFTPQATEDTSTHITSMSFEPNVLICSSAMRDAGASGNILMGVGVCANDETTVTQAGMVTFDRDGQATSEGRGAVAGDRWPMEVNDTPTVDYAIEFANFDSLGFEAFTRDGGGDNTDRVGVLALGLPADIDAKVTTHTTPASTGNEDFTGTGFTPQFAMMLMTRHIAMPGVAAGGYGSSIGVSVNTVNDQFSAMGRHEDEVGTTNTGCILDDKSANLPADTDSGTTPIEADFVSFLSDGIRLDFTSASTHKWAMLTIESPTTGALSATITDTDAVSADADLASKLSATIAETDAVSADADLASKISATIAEADAVSADLTITGGALSATIADSDAVSADAILASKISATIAEVDAVSADLTITGGATVALSATIKETDSRVVRMSVGGTGKTRSSVFMG